MQQRHGTASARSSSSSGDLSVTTTTTTTTSGIGSAGGSKQQHHGHTTVLGSTTAPTTSATDPQSAASASASAAAATRQRRRLRRRDGKSTSTSTTTSTATGDTSTSTSTTTSTGASCFNWVFTFLMLGLLFCLMDAFYIMRFIMVRDEQQVVNVMAEAPATSKRTMTNNDHGNDHGNSNANANANSNDNDHDEHHILNLLSEAGITNLDASVLAKLPAWSDVTALYGPAPVIIAGLQKITTDTTTTTTDRTTTAATTTAATADVCRAFQESGDAGDHFLATAGTFNTGTNLMAELLIANCHMPARMKKYGALSRGVRWQVLWGKHTPVGGSGSGSGSEYEVFRQEHRTYNDSSLTADNTFPVVTVRDPFKWMQSMCRHEYGAHWHHDERHCPNLVPNQVERERGWVLPSPDNDVDGTSSSSSSSSSHNNTNTNTIPVTLKYAAFTQYHTSLVDFWNSWYQGYTKATFPKLIVRFEDLVFHPKQVTQAVCECAGGAMNQHPFHYIVDSAKKGDGAHGKERTSYVDALVKYGTEQGRYKGMTGEDVQFARQYLDPALMELFGYPYPSA